MKIIEKKTHQTVKFINQLDHTNNLSQWIFNGHTQDGFVFEIWSIVDTLVKAMIVVSIGDVHRLYKFENVPNENEISIE